MSNREIPLISIVDDNPQNLQFLGHLLQKNGYEPILCKSGEIALDSIKKRKPDLILLDIMMPKIDGIETCRRIKQNDATKDIPVIFITVLTDTSDKLKAFEVGGVDYITKPFQQEEVLARVSTHLALQSQRQELVEQKKELFKSNTDKEVFISIIAHDLKSPFTGLLGLVDILKGSVNDLAAPERQKIADSMFSSINKTYRLLTELLNWSKLHRGEMEYQPIKLDLYDLVKANIQLFADNASSKNIKLRCLVEPGNIAYADRNMVDSILRNLVNNAIKFTNKGGEVTVSAQPLDSSASTGPNHSMELGRSFVEISVSDNGIGLSQQGKEKIFRLDNKYQTEGTNGETGSGLGLMLCKDLVEKNSGRIWVESEEGKGTTFKFTIPKD